MAEPKPRQVLVYDGGCGFCTRCAEWARRRLPHHYDVVAWQRISDLSALGLTTADVSNSSCWIDSSGRPHLGERGVALVLIEIGGLWAVVGRALLLPPIRVVAAALYQFIARNRHRMPGGSAACQIDDAYESDHGASKSRVSPAGAACARGSSAARRPTR